MENHASLYEVSVISPSAVLRIRSKAKRRVEIVIRVQVKDGGFDVTYYAIM